MRVLAVADVYEALTADRPYRGPMSVEQALAIIDRDVPGAARRRRPQRAANHLGPRARRHQAPRG